MGRIFTISQSCDFYFRFDSSDYSFSSAIISCSRNYSVVTLFPSLIVIVPFITFRLLRCSFSEGILITEANLVVLKKTMIFQRIGNNLNHMKKAGGLSDAN